MRKNDLWRGLDVVVRLAVSHYDHDYFQLTFLERKEKRRYVRAKIIGVPSEGRQVRIEYEGETYDGDIRKWVRGPRKQDIDSRSVVRTGAEQDAIEKAAWEQEKQRILQNTYEQMVKAQPLVEQGELIQTTVELLDSLGVAAVALGSAWAGDNRWPTCIQISGDGVAQLRQFLLTATLT